MPIQNSSAGSSALAPLIGGRIRKAREDARLSQGVLAEALGLSQAAMSTIESGARPLRVDELVVISRVTGRDIEYFLAPSRMRSEPVGVSLRAQVAELPVPEYRAAIGDFLDENEAVALPTPRQSVTADDPDLGARQVLAATNQAALPVDVHGIARDLGVAVISRPLPDALSALIIRHGIGAIIGVNSNHASTRQRFSIAHELGHFVLHHRAQHFIEFEPQSDGDPPHYEWQKERGANIFAAELLMPADRVRADVKSFSVGRLAKRYGVSEAAMGFRLANLRLQSG